MRILKHWLELLFYLAISILGASAFIWVVGNAYEAIINKLIN